MSTNNSSANDKNVLPFKDFAEKRICATPVSFETTEVSIQLDAVVLTEYKAELYASWDQAASMRGFELSFSEEELSKYIDMIIITRVEYTRGRKVLVKPVDGFAVPSFLSCILSNIGLARNADLGIELVPVVERGQRTVSPNEIDYDFMVKISRAIKVLGRIGVEYAEGYTRSRDGSYEFMSMAMIDDYVRNVANTAHPVYALMASVLGVRGIEAVLSPRVNYGSVNHMKTLVRHLAQVKG